MTAATSTDLSSARIARSLAASLGPQRFGMWFGRSARLDYQDAAARLVVVVPNRFVADWIGRHFQQDLLDAAQQAVGASVAVSIVEDPRAFDPAADTAHGHAPEAGEGLDHTAAARPTREGQAAGRGQAAPAHAPGRRRSAGGPEGGLALRYRLEDFIVGPSNELAFAAACRLVDDDEAPGNPLFVHGGVGLGKTHLLQGLCRRLLAQKPQARVLYTTGEQFTNDFVAAVRSGKLEEFRKRIRRLDLLAVDDVRFLADKDKTQQEFLHTFNAMELGGARMALASDCHPRLIQQFSEALVSRCVRGLVVQIQPPDTATRLRIIKALAQRRGVCLVETVAATIAGHCHGSVRELEGTLTKLTALAAMSQRRTSPAAEPDLASAPDQPSAAPDDDATPSASASPARAPLAINHAVVNQLLHAQAQQAPARVIRFQTVLAVVAEHLGQTPAAVQSGRRTRELVLARSLTVHLARKLTGMSWPEIALALDRTGHSTVIAADRRMAQAAAQGLRVVIPANLAAGQEAQETSIADLIARLEHDIRRA